uniref:basic proline-rich protein-like n=1 Tax=Nyctereutes procyonoides TaxID=34880 RepID=UPI002444851F|nr:basic proline-rich protein-like [Nyctereutes procyonoides]XP_055189853.1 basic proline-rich protein-like [Nyctereutes procyonoides]XP_055189855.1 basic proline-rich protein-like [Nyctereutes procyonoides]
MLTTIPPTLHSPGRPRTPAQAPHQRLLALSPSRHRLRRLPRPCPDVPAGRSSAPSRAPPAAARRPTRASPTQPLLLRSPAPPAQSARPPRPPPREARQPGSCPSRERGARGGQPPVRRSRLGWAEPARARAPGGAGGRVDGGQDGPPRSPRASGRTGPGGGTTEEKEEKEGPGGRRPFGQRGGRDQKRACLASPSGNRTPVSRVTGGDTHHYTNEDGGGGRPGARPLSARPRPPRAPGHGPPGPTPRPPRQRAQQSPWPDSERRAPDPPPPRPSRTGMAAGEDARHGKQGCASEQEAPRRGWAAAGGGGPDAGSRSPLEAWVRIPLLTRPPFGPPNAGSPHPGLDHALSVPPYTPLRAGGALARVARDPRSCSASALPATGLAPPRPPSPATSLRLSLLLIPRRPRASATRRHVSPARLSGGSVCPLPSRRRPLQASRGPKCRQPRAGRATLPPVPAEGRASLASSLSQPRPTPPPARRERGVPTACPFRRPPFIPWSPPPPSPGRPRGVATWRPHHGHTPATRAAEPSARQPETGPPPRSLGLAREGGAGGSTPPWWLRGALSARQPCLPGPPTRAPGRASPRRKPLRGRDSRTPARSLTAPPASQPAAAPPKRTCRPHPHRSPAGPDGELRAELTRLSLASWLGRYSAAPGGATGPPSPPTTPTPAPAGAHCTGRTAIRPRASGGAPGRKGRSALSCAGHRRPALPGNRARVRLGQAPPRQRQDSVWRRPRPRERAQGEPSPPRGLAGTVDAARRPEPEPEPEPSAPLHGRGACVADRGPAARPRAGGAHHWPCRDDDERRWGSRLVAATTAPDALYGDLAAVSFKRGPLPTAKVTASTRSIHLSRHRR